MRKQIGRALPGAALLITCSAAQAGYTVEKGNLTAELNLAAGAAALYTRDVNFGSGRVDVRSGANTGNSADWQEFYLTPGATLKYQLNPDVRLVGGASAVAATTLGDGDAAGLTRSSDGSIKTEELYAGIESNGWRLTLGNQNFMIGNGFIVMDGNLDMFNDGAFWTAPRHAFRNSGVLRYDTDAYSVQAFSLKADKDLGSYRMNGANFDYYLGERSMLGIMGMTLQADSGSTPRDGMNVYSIRGLGLSLPSLPNLKFSGEYGIQTGSGNGTKYDANAWFTELEYTLADLKYRPRIGYRHSSFSGDSNLSDNKRKSWDSLSKGYVDWGTWVIGDITGNYLLNNSNEVVDQLWLRADLNPTLSVGTIHYKFSLDQANLYGVPVSGTHFADETTLFLDWNPTPSISTSVAYGWVNPNKVAKSFFGNKRYSTLELYFSYRY